MIQVFLRIIPVSVLLMHIMRILLNHVTLVIIVVRHVIIVLDICLADVQHVTININTGSLKMETIVNVLRVVMEKSSILPLQIMTVILMKMMMPLINVKVAKSANEKMAGTALLIDLVLKM